MTHRLHRRLKNLERRAKRAPLQKRWSWLAVEYAREGETQRRIEAGDMLDALRAALDAISERFARWRKRNASKPGMPLTKQERPVVRDALRCADYIDQFDARYPHNDDGAPCRVMHGDASLLTQRPPEVGLIVWEVVTPELDADTREHLDALARQAERKRRAQDEDNERDVTAPSAPQGAVSAVAVEPAPGEERQASWADVKKNLMADVRRPTGKRRDRELEDAIRQRRTRTAVLPLFLGARDRRR